MGIAVTKDTFMKSLKPLNPDDFPITLIEDLGMIKPLVESKKFYRYGIFECPSCKKHFKASINNVKTGNHLTCNPVCDLHKPKEVLSQAELQDIFAYDPLTGKFTRKKKLARRHIIGEEVGVATVNGYLKCRIGVKEYLLHRLVWLYVYGVWPKQIDHIDGNPKNNRLNNLRNVTNEENAKNLKVSKKNSSGIIGVSYIKCLWVAQICVNGKRYRKSFKTKFGAIRQRLKWNKEFNFHKNHGKR